MWPLFKDCEGRICAWEAQEVQVGRMPVQQIGGQQSQGGARQPLQRSIQALPHPVALNSQDLMQPAAARHPMRDALPEIHRACWLQAFGNAYRTFHTNEQVMQAFQLASEEDAAALQELVTSGPDGTGEYGYEAWVFRTKMALQYMALGCVAPDRLALLHAKGMPAYMAFFVGFLPQGQQQPECLYLTQPKEAYGMRSWQSYAFGQAGGYVRCALGRDAAGDQVHTYLHRLITWAYWGDMPPPRRRMHQQPQLSEVDHTCSHPSCVYAGHLKWSTHPENVAQGAQRRREAAGAHS
jgi:hypothetical protein